VDQGLFYTGTDTLVQAGTVWYRYRYKCRYKCTYSSSGHNLVHAGTVRYMYRYKCRYTGHVHVQVQVHVQDMYKYKRRYTSTTHVHPLAVDNTIVARFVAPIVAAQVEIESKV
jgi:hypothetical protein